jgi:hypothetical protein
LVEEARMLSEADIAAGCLRARALERIRSIAFGRKSLAEATFDEWCLSSNAIASAGG